MYPARHGTMTASTYNRFGGGYGGQPATSPRIRVGRVVSPRRCHNAREHDTTGRGQLEAVRVTPTHQRRVTRTRSRTRSRTHTTWTRAGGAGAISKSAAPAGS